jgi:hypothetical protein
MTIDDVPDRESERKGKANNIAAEKLLHGLKSTSASRFNAAKRLAAKDRALTRLTAFTSAYLIILTALPYFMKLPQEITDYLNLLTVVFAIIVLVSSLLQYSSGDVVSAEQHHRAGLELSEIARELAIKIPIIDGTELLAMASRYSATLQKYSINHDDVDFLRYQMENQEKYPWLTWSARASIRVQTFAVKHVFSAVLIAITVLLIGLVLGMHILCACMCLAIPCAPKPSRCTLSRVSPSLISVFTLAAAEPASVLRDRGSLLPRPSARTHRSDLRTAGAVHALAHARCGGGLTGAR